MISIILQFLVVALASNKGFSFECHICEPKSIAHIVEFPSLRNEYANPSDVGDCETFNESDPFFTKECPDHLSRACIKADLDGSEWRMCGAKETHYINGECEKIRDVVVCTCDLERCNTAPVQAASSLQILFFGTLTSILFGNMVGRNRLLT